MERYESGRKKHFRRCANEIAKSYTCPYADCQKFYGSEGSLNLHMKLKHNAGSKTDREKLAKTLVSAYHTGAQTPIIMPNINLPPGVVEKAAQSLGVEVPHGAIEKHILALEKIGCSSTVATVAAAEKKQQYPLINSGNEEDITHDNF